MSKIIYGEFIAGPYDGLIACFAGRHNDMATLLVNDSSCRYMFIPINELDFYFKPLTEQKV